MEHEPQTIELFGVRVLKATRAEAIAALERRVDAGRALAFYVNAHTLNLLHGDPEYRNVLLGADLIFNDGSGVALAARMKGERFPENLNGTDLNPAILELAARRGWSVFFLGAGPGVAESAAGKLRSRIGGLEVAGIHDGYFPRERDADVVAAVRKSGADVVMVAMGNPLQERWLTANLDATGARLGVGVGAFFDFSAERVSRAPGWMKRLGIEWVYRLYLEPSRMWRRYLLGNPLFLARAARDAWRSRRTRA